MRIPIPLIFPFVNNFGKHLHNVNSRQLSTKCFFFNFPGEPSDTATVNITVIDINDNDPVFGDTCKDLVLPENVGRDFSLVHTVTAFDRDQGDNGRLTYALLDPPTSAFRVDESTGALYARPLDREARDIYDLVIVATDNDQTVR